MRSVAAGSRAGGIDGLRRKMAGFIVSDTGFGYSCPCKENV